MTTPRILIIEDEVGLATGLATVCQRLGARATLCSSGESGLQEFLAGHFALVILDVGLPDMSGLRVLETINRAASRPPVLIITAHGTLDNAVAARQLGADGYLVKPLDLAHLDRTIQELLTVSSPATDAPPPATHTDDVSTLLGGAAPAMQPVFVNIAHATVSDAPVLYGAQLN